MKKKLKPDLYQDNDPIEGYKAVGCLFVGVVLLLATLSLFGWFIHLIQK
jgi:hypothetical protein